VDHLGFVRTRTAAKDKKARDVRLLRGCIVDEPFDFHSRLKLLELARASHDGPLWQHSAREATDALEQAGRDALALRPLGGELIALIAEGLFTASSSAGLAYLEDWAPRLLPSAPFFHQRGVVHEHLGDLVKARADYERCLTLGDELGDGQDLVRPRLGLARLCLAAGDAELAAAHAAAALDHSPRDPEALVAVVTLRRALEGPRALDDWEAEHRARHPACPERDWAIGEALYTLGDFKGAVAKLRLGAGVPPSGPAAVRLGQALLADGQLEAAEASCRALLAAEPEAGLGVLVFDLMRGDSTELDLDLTAETANAAMRHWIDALLASKNVTWRKKLAKNVDAVQELFPWLGEYLARRAG
jgi:tetratricopeptide (TPR) repeat protein